MHYLLLFLLIFPITSFAEVSDKILLVPEMWTQSLALGVLCFYLSSKKWWLSIVGILLFVLFILGIIDAESDEFFRNAVVKEQGEVYFIHRYISAIFLLIFTAAGCFWGFKKRGVKST